MLASFRIPNQPMSRWKMVKTLQQLSLEAVVALIQMGIDKSAAKSYEKVAGDLNLKTRVQNILKSTDRDIKEIGQFMFGSLAKDIINDLIRLFLRAVSKGIEKQQAHRLFDLTDLECFTCHNIITSTRFLKLCLDSRVTTLDLNNIVGGSQKKYLLREMSKCGGKRVANLSETTLPISIKEFNENIMNNFSALRYLKIDFFVDNTTLAIIGRTCHQLEHLEIDQSFVLNNTGLNKLIKGCKNIRTLLFGSSTLITHQAYATALLTLPRLERIGRIGIRLISVIKLVHSMAPERQLNLKFLESNEKELITNNESCLEIITRVCPGLRHITLSVFCPKLSPLAKLNKLNSIHLNGFGAGNHHKSLSEILNTQGHQISTIELSTSAGISVSDIYRIGQSCPYLECLILRNCSFIQDTQEDTSPVEKLNRMFPHLKILYFTPAQQDNALDILMTILMAATNIEELYIEECPDISDDVFLDLIDSNSIQLLRVLQINSLRQAKIYTKLTTITVHATIDVCHDLVELGDISKWNIDAKTMAGLKSVISENNFDLKLSNDSQLKFHDKFFYY